MDHVDALASLVRPFCALISTINFRLCVVFRVQRTPGGLVALQAALWAWYIGRSPGELSTSPLAVSGALNEFAHGIAAENMVLILGAGEPIHARVVFGSWRFGGR